MADVNLKINLSYQQRVWLCILSLTTLDMCTPISNTKSFQKTVYDPGSLISLIPRW